MVQNVHEGVSLLRDAFLTASDNVKEALRDFLGAQISSPSKRVRLAVLQYLNRLYPFSDSASRFLCVLLARDGAGEVMEEAKRGIRKMDNEEEAADGSTSAPKAGSATATLAKGDLDTYPDFPSFVGHASSEIASLKEKGSDLYSPHMLEDVLVFTQKCLAGSAKKQGVSEGEYTSALRSSDELHIRNSITTFQGLIESAFETGFSEVEIAASSSLVQLVRSCPELFASVYAARWGWLQLHLLDGHRITRQNMAILLGLLADRFPVETTTQMINTLAETFTAADDNKQSGRKHGCLLGMGVLCLGTSLDATDATRTTKTRGISCVLQALRSTTVLLTAAACDAVACLVEQGPLAYGADLGFDSSEALVECLSKLCKGKERKEERLAERAVRTIGKVCVGDRSTATLQASLEQLFSLVSVKYEEVQFAVGRALAEVGEGTSCRRPVEEAVLDMNSDDVYIGGVGSTDATATAEAESEEKRKLAQEAAGSDEAEFTLSSEKPDNSSTSAGKEDDSKMEVEEKEKEKEEERENEEEEGKKKTALKSRTAMGHILHRILNQFLLRGSLVQRTASVTWLLCVVRFSGYHPLVQSSLGDVQAAFSRSLTESKQYIQEVASKGLALVYDRGDAAMKEQLVEGLTSTFSTGTRRVTGDTQIMVNANKEEFATYRELCNVATEMGQPDLVYKFMDLANHHSIWNSKVGAAFSLGSILSASSALAPQLHTLIPKLFRYQYDPNEMVQSTMRTLWTTLVPDPKSAVEEHFDVIMKELLSFSGSRQYRDRESSCGALQDLISGRSIDELEKYLEDVWVALFRLLDDIKDSVRKTASSFGKSLTSLCVRLCDETYSSARKVPRAMASVFPILLHKGITDHAQEVRAISVNAVLKITKVGGKHLRPHLADLVTVLLEGLSTLEPQMFSYLQFHTASMDISQEQMEKLRMSVSRSSPLNEALSTCLMVIDGDSLGPVLDAVKSILRAGLGLPTLTASAKFLISLTSTHSVAHLMKPHTTGLISTLQGGLLDQSPTIRKLYANAVGALCSVGKSKRVGKVIRQMVEMYVSSDAPKKRFVSGLVLASIVKHAAETAKEYSIDYVPTAFLALHDSDKETAEVWNSVWEESVPGMATGCRLFISDIISVIVKTFHDAQDWTLKTLSLRSLQKLIPIVGSSLEPKHVEACVDLLVGSLPGRIWDGKEMLFEALGELVRQCHNSMSDEVKSTVVAGVSTECDRKKKVYVVAASECLGACAETLSVDVTYVAHEMLIPLVGSMQEVLDGIGSNLHEKNEEKVNESRKLRISSSSLLSRLLDALSLILSPTAEQSRQEVEEHLAVFNRFAVGSDLIVRKSAMAALNKCFKAVVDHTPSYLDTALVKPFVENAILCMKDGKQPTLRLAAVEFILVLVEHGMLSLFLSLSFSLSFFLTTQLFIFVLCSFFVSVQILLFVLNFFANSFLPFFLSLLDASLLGGLRSSIHSLLGDLTKDSEPRVIQKATVALTKL